MSVEKVLEAYPDRYLKPEDGLAVTAELWEAAHDYHRQSLRMHHMLCHRPGILCGLEVIASDPPDTSVSIKPGVAVDAEGQVIMLPLDTAYDMGQDSVDVHYLWLSFDKIDPASGGAQQDQPKYVRAEASCEATTESPPRSGIELARVDRSRRGAPVRNARSPAQPGPDEIDLRYRRHVGVDPDLSVAVCYLGDVGGRKHGRGMLRLARALNRSSPYWVTLNDNTQLGPHLSSTALLYLVAAGSFELSPRQIQSLVNYVQRDQGTLLIESVDAPAEAGCRQLLKAMELVMAPLTPGHPLLLEPYLFAGPPPGFEPQDAGQVLVSEGVIFSTCNYGLLWGGEMHAGLPSRERIHAAQEWGGNILDYARRRRR